MSQYKIVLILGLTATLQSIGFAASSDTSLVDEMRACSIRTPNSDRLECFDSLTRTLPNTAGQNIKGTSVLPENLGGGKFDKASKKSEESIGVVTSCKKSHDGRWFFIFENGQIWKQSNKDTRPRRYKDCNFTVAIKKDGFGYKMYVEALSREVRVKRVK